MALLPNSVEIFPIIVGKSAFLELDLSVTSNLNVYNWESEVNQLVAAHPQKLLIGGYLEERFFYLNESLYGIGADRRKYHLGIDLWEVANTEIHAPIAGRVHSIQYNDADLDYGHTIVLQHDVNGSKFHTLYGHLSSWHSRKLKENNYIAAGTCFCKIGDKPENGGWLPHLHFQLIMDMQGKVGDYPGVASAADLDYYRNNCPDPKELILVKQLS